MWNLNLTHEANDAGSLFSHGLRVTRDVSYDYTDATAAMSLLALGAEKLLKLTIGLAHLDRSEPWPSLRYMKRFRHRVAAADVEARTQIPLTRGTVPGHLQQRAADIDSDPVLGAVLLALERFGDTGRFYFLDSLGERPQTEPAPHFLWVGMVSDVIKNDAALSAKMMTAEGLREGRPEVNRTIVRSLVEWWEFYRTVWTTGAIGDQAKEFSSAIRLLHH